MVFVNLIKSDRTLLSQGAADVDLKLSMCDEGMREDLMSWITHQ